MCRFCIIWWCEVVGAIIRQKRKSCAAIPVKSRHLFVAIAALLLFVPFQDAFAAEPKWPKEPYKYLVIDQDLREVLTEFGRNIRIPVKLSENVAKRRIRNDMAVAAPREFLQRICDTYGLVWYYDGAVLTVSDDSEVRTELLNTGAVGSETLLARLDSLGVNDARYPIRTSNAGVITVSGPPPYLSMVRKTLDALEKASTPRPVQEVTSGDTQKVRVFRGGKQGS
jgi:type II secretory pathway component GspD/PulD (secretin)